MARELRIGFIYLFIHIKFVYLFIFFIFGESVYLGTNYILRKSFFLIYWHNLIVCSGNCLPESVAMEPNFIFQKLKLDKALDILDVMISKGYDPGFCRCHVFRRT